jgi:hypothetical protein
MSQSVDDDLATSIQRIRDELDAWRKRGSRISTTALGSRINEFEELRAKAELYRTALGMAVDHLTTEIAESEAVARTMLDRAMGIIQYPDHDDHSAGRYAAMGCPECQAAQAAAQEAKAEAAPHPDPRIGSGSAFDIPTEAQEPATPGAAPIDLSPL